MKLAVVFLMIIIAGGCNNPAPHQEATPQTTPAQTDFFPVTSFIGGQVHVVDSFQAITMKYVTTGNKTDTALISIAQFNDMAQEFMQPDFNAPVLKKEYKENSFADQSIKGVVFNYSTTNKDLEIQRVDVVLDASAVANDKVRSIYMEKQSHKGDTMIFKKLYWRTDHNFQIITVNQMGDKPATMQVTKVEWSI